MSIVNQEPVLFQTSILDNIRYGKPDASRAEIEAAARAANAHDFITALQEGYDTNCGQAGSLLSGGQKQVCSVCVCEPAVCACALCCVCVCACTHSMLAQTLTVCVCVCSA